jgi:hypothetical protein
VSIWERYDDLNDVADVAVAMSYGAATGRPPSDCLLYGIMPPGYYDKDIQPVANGRRMSEMMPEWFAKAEMDIQSYRLEIAAKELAARLTDDDVSQFLGELRQWANSRRKTQQPTG